MTHIIAEPCVDTKDTACVDVCPVDCIYGTDEDWEILYIHPEECIDCGLCIDACPKLSWAQMVCDFTFRHIQHHAAQLSLRLRMDDNTDVRWVKRGWAS